MSEKASELAGMRKTVTHECAICGDEFEGIKQAKYCSNACRQKAKYQRSQKGLAGIPAEDLLDELLKRLRDNIDYDKTADDEIGKPTLVKEPLHDLELRLIDLLSRWKDTGAAETS